MSYTCDFCNFNTTNKAIYTTHQASQKHIKKIKEHENDEKEMHHISTIIKHKQMQTAIFYVIKNNYNPKILRNMTNAKKINHGSPNIKFIDDMMYQFELNELHKYIGDYIIEQYKIPNCKKQQLWCVDVACLHFIIKTDDDFEKNINGWAIDRNGSRVITRITHPITKYMYTVLDKNIHYIDTKESKKLIDARIKMWVRFRNLKDTLCDNYEFEKKILQYIAPHFYLDTTNNQIQ